MPANLGIMVTRCRYFNLAGLRVADTQILSCNLDAANQFRRRPEQLAGMFMSDLQSHDWRAAGHQRYLDRKLGRAVTQDYAVMIQTPDGESVGQRREFGGWLHSNVSGEDMYLTYLEEIKEVDHGPTIRSLTPEERILARQYNGDCTVADLRVMPAYTMPLALRESFPHIIRECEDLSSALFAGKYFSPLDLALSDDTAVCWYGKAAAQTTPVVRSRFVCEHCGWIWYGRAKRKVQCTAAGCRKVFYDARRD